LTSHARAHARLVRRARAQSARSNLIRMRTKSAANRGRVPKAVLLSTMTVPRQGVCLLLLIAAVLVRAASEDERISVVLDTEGSLSSMTGEPRPSNVTEPRLSGNNEQRSASNGMFPGLKKFLGSTVFQQNGERSGGK
jgi:hypothetical protein